MPACQKPFPLKNRGRSNVQHETQERADQPLKVLETHVRYKKGFPVRSSLHTTTTYLQRHCQLECTTNIH